MQGDRWWQSAMKKNEEKQVEERKLGRWEDREGAILYEMTMEGLFDKVTFEQRPQGSDRVMWILVEGFSILLDQKPWDLSCCVSLGQQGDQCGWIRGYRREGWRWSQRAGGRGWQIGPCRPSEDVSRPVRLKERGNPRIVLSRVVTWFDVV